MSRYWDDSKNDVKFAPVVRDFVLGLVALVAAGMYGCPKYNVWQQGLVGEAG